jgi:hypothetical protein
MKHAAYKYIFWLKNTIKSFQPLTAFSMYEEMMQDEKARGENTGKSQKKPKLTSHTLKHRKY